MELESKYNITLDDIRYICNNFFGMFKIPVYFLSSNGEVVFEFSYEYSQNPVYQNYNDLYKEFLKIVSDMVTVVISTTKFFETFVFIKVKNQDTLLGTIIIGPSLNSEINEKAIDEMIKSNNIQAKLRGSLVKYYKHMIIINYDSLIQAFSLLYFSIYREKLDRKLLTEDYDIFAPSASGKEKDFDSFMMSNRRDNFFHHSPRYENELLSCVREGNKEKLLEFSKKALDGEMGLHSKNPLRNQKNLFISIVPLVSHAAIEGGLDWELALSLSDYYVQTVEEQNSIKDIMNLNYIMVVDYTERVRLARAGHSSPIVKCKNYIFEHLFDKLSLAKIAETTGMNPSYISHLFKQEVGLTISEYIQKERIEEAKKLMLSSDKSLTEIYTPLGFIDQSHFTKVFKKIVGTTPKEYRVNNKHIFRD